MRQIIALYIYNISPFLSQLRLHSQTMCQKLSTTLLGTSSADQKTLGTSSHVQLRVPGLIKNKLYIIIKNKKYIYFFL